jgi:GT2 family glycosyltransferase
MAKNNTELTIYIVHYNKVKQLKKTVRLLFERTYSKFYLKIMNNGYIDKEIENYLKSLEKKGVEVVYSKNNLGPSAGRKILSENIDTKYIMALDDDMYVNKNWDVPIINKFKKNFDVGAIGFLLYDTNENFIGPGGEDIKLVKKIIKRKKPFIDPNNCSKYISIDTIGSGAIVYKNNFKDNIVWDPNYKVTFEDLNMKLKLKQSKKRCFISTQSRIIHDKVSDKPEYRDYNKVRRNYKKIREDYIYFVKSNSYRLDYKKHLFYKYICILPNKLVRNIAYFYLKNLKKH